MTTLTVVLAILGGLAGGLALVGLILLWCAWLDRVWERWYGPPRPHSSAERARELRRQSTSA
ncbi:MAG: hypothetical protein M3355_06550 [Actinomycetota bacterium]|nr:hypothetical protein [Actinomycetota bacterium]